MLFACDDVLTEINQEYSISTKHMYKKVRWWVLRIHNVIEI